MANPSKIFSRHVAPAGALILASLGAGAAQAQQGAVPLHQHPTRIFSFETANMNPAGTLQLDVGTIQTEPGDGPGAGTGNQLYFGGGSYALSDRVSLGIDIQSYWDPVLDPILGAYPDIIAHMGALWGKYQLFDNGRFAVAAQASVENYFTLESPLWGGKNKNVVIGSLKAPMTYRASQALELHLTPSVSVSPNTVGGAPFYGTIVSLGAGVSYKPNERLTFAAAVDAPISGGNTLTNTASFKKVPVWTVSGRYNLTPKLALEGHVTNGVGYTPATSIMTHWPDGDRILAGVRLVYTPGAKRPESYRGTPVDATPHMVSLQQDGFTLGSADVMEPGFARLSAWYGSDDNAGMLIGFSPDRDGEIQLSFEQYSQSTSAPGAIIPKQGFVRFMLGPKLRFMDQNNGDPMSLSARLLFGRQIESGAGGVGVFYLDAMAGYQVNSRLTLNASPKFAAWGNTEMIGLGLGVHYALSRDLAVIGEVTPVGLDGADATWAAGMRYNLGKSGFSVDASVSNAIGRFGIGSMISQDDARVTIALSKSFSLRGLRP